MGRVGGGTPRLPTAQHLAGVPVVLASRCIGIAAAGQFAAMYNLTRSSVNPLISVFQGPLFAATSKEPGLERLTSTLQIVSLLTWSPYIFIAITSSELIDMLYGARWSGASPVLATCSITMIFYTILSVSGPVLWGRGRVGLDLKIQLAGAAFALVLLASINKISTSTLVNSFLAVTSFRALASLYFAASCYPGSRVRLARAAARSAALAIAANIPSAVLLPVLRSTHCGPFVLIVMLGGTFAITYMLLTLTFFRYLLDTSVIERLEKGIRIFKRIGVRP